MSEPDKTGMTWWLKAEHTTLQRARILAEISHANIVNVSDADLDRIAFKIAEALDAWHRLDREAADANKYGVEWKDASQPES